MDTNNINGVIIYRELYDQMQLLSIAERGEAITIILSTLFGEPNTIDVETFSSIARVTALSAINSANASRKRYENAAEKQRAYRMRKKVSSVTECYDSVTALHNDVTDVTLLNTETNTETETKTKTEIDKEKSANAPKRNTPNKPTREQIKEYCKKRNNAIDADYFYDYYEARGWKYSNGQPMKDFQAAIRTWESKEKNKGGAARAPERPKSQIRGEGWVDKEHYDHW